MRCGDWIDTRGKPPAANHIFNPTALASYGECEFGNARLSNEDAERQFALRPDRFSSLGEARSFTARLLVPLSVLDRLRDGVEAALMDGAGSAAPTLRKVGMALSRASHAVERAPGFKLGEDPDTRVSDGAGGRYRSLTLATLAALAIGATIMRQQRRTVRSA